MFEPGERTVIMGRTVNSVPPSGFEPEINGLKTHCPRPLDDGGLLAFYQIELTSSTLPSFYTPIAYGRRRWTIGVRKYRFLFGEHQVCV